MIAVDANVVVGLLVGGESGSDAERLFEKDQDWVAPKLLSSEFRNVLVGLIRRGLVDPETAGELNGEADEMFSGCLVEVSGRAALETAIDAGLSAYDAEYVVVALQLGIPLATRDGRILRAAPGIAIPLAEA